MTLIQYTFILFAIYLCVYALINRVCQCIDTVKPPGRIPSSEKMEFW